MLRSVRHASEKQSGFSLVELMVGMVIGLLGILVIMQVSILFQSQKSTTSSSSKAENAGAIALYAIQSEIEQAGYGISSPSLIGCSVQLRPGVTIGALAPLVINDASIPAGDANTDTLLVAYTSAFLQTEGDALSQKTGTFYTVRAPTMFNAGDAVIAQAKIRATPCTGLTLDTVQSNPPIDYTNGILPAAPATNSVLDGKLFNLGPVAAIKIHAYAVRGGVLTQCDFMASDCTKTDLATCGQAGQPPCSWVPIAENIVSLRAQYGRDTLPANPPMDGIVDGYDQVPPAPAPAYNFCDYMRIPAMRMALVARSSQFEKILVTTTASNPGLPDQTPRWAGSSGAPLVGGGTLGPNTQADEPWKHYRYKVFETTIPIRNIAWMAGTGTGC